MPKKEEWSCTSIPPLGLQGLYGPVSGQQYDWKWIADIIEKIKSPKTYALKTYFLKELLPPLLRSSARACVCARENAAWFSNILPDRWLSKLFPVTPQRERPGAHKEYRMKLNSCLFATRSVPQKCRPCSITRILHWPNTKFRVKICYSNYVLHSRLFIIYNL